MQRKHKLLLGISLIFAIILFVGTRLAWRDDENIDALQNWIEINSDIVRTIGGVKTAEVTRITHVSESSSNSAYTKYTFLVKGENGKAIVRITVKESRFELTDIEKL
jgi:hypothetical protein